MENRNLKTSEVVEEFGWQVICGPEDKQGPSFAYYFKDYFGHAIAFYEGAMDKVRGIVL